MGISNLITKPQVVEESVDGSPTRPGPRRLRLSPPALAFVVGALCGVLPAVFLYSPVLRGPEAGGLVAAVLYVQRFGIEWLRDTQDVFLPYLVIGPAMSLAGLAGAYIVTALSLVSLTGITCYIARKLGLTLLSAVIVAVGALTFPVILSSAKDLPMYLPMLSFGYLGTWLVYHAGSGNARRWLLAAACGGLCVVLAAESHGIGQLFYAAPLLTLVLNPARRGLLALGTAYGSAILFSIPRLLINFSEGGLSHIRGTRTDYWVTEGYLDLINTEFWGHPVSVDRWEYFAGMDQQVAEAVGQFGALVGVLAISAIFIVRARQRWFVASCLALMVLPLIIITPPQFPRYLAPIVPGIALLAGVAIDFLLDKTRRPRRSRVGTSLRLVGPVAIAGVVAGAIAASIGSVQAVGRAETSRGIHAQRTIAKHIDDDKAVIGVRSTRLHAAGLQYQTYGSLFLSEQEYVTFLTWPSDEEVIEMMKRRNIGWVLLRPERSRRYEVDYNNSWLIPTYGLRSRHRKSVRSSPNFCEAAQFDGVRLFRLGACASS